MNAHDVKEQQLRSEQIAALMPVILQMQIAAIVLFILFSGWDYLIDPLNWLRVQPLRLLCITAHGVTVYGLRQQWGVRYLPDLIVGSALVSMTALCFITAQLTGASSYIPLLLSYYLVSLLSCVTALPAAYINVVFLAAFLLPNVVHTVSGVTPAEILRTNVVWAPLIAFAAVVTTVLRRQARESFQLTLTLEAAATIDALTGLRNRRKVREILESECLRARRYHRPMCVMLFDLDHFKAVNDGHGHPTGDRVLQSVAQIVVASVRESDVVGRIGGDEFLIVLPECTVHAALELAERVRTNVASMVWTGHRDLVCTVSIGVTELHEHELTDTLLARADLALYAAKGQGRDRICLWEQGLDERRHHA